LKEKNLGIKLWLKICFGFAFVFLVSLFIYHWYSVINDSFIASHTSATITAGVTELGFFIVVMVVYTIYYMTYYQKHFKSHILTNEEIVQQNNVIFSRIDDFAESAKIEF
jgi:hypothetical protein